jgi:putative ABC transport system ATP-binding protein
VNLIDIRNIRRVYSTKNNVAAIDRLSLSVGRGEFLAVVGPSGSGKTTLLNLMGALDRPTSGEIFFEGTDITKLSKSRLAELRLHHIGFVFQTYNLISSLTVEENIEFVLRLQGMSSDRIRRRVHTAVDTLGLSALVSSKPSDISYGQQQRVAIARAIVSEPKCVLADEPTASLDSKTGRSVIEMMRRINRERGITFIVATHDLPVIAECDRIVEIKDGRIVGGD